jgi:uncharacterized membrane protein
VRSSARERIRGSAITATLLLIAAIVAWIALPTLSLIRVSIAIAATAPLWMWLPSLWRENRRSFAAMTLCIVPYMVAALTELIANPAARIWASATLVLSFALFVLLIAFLRLTRTIAAP